MAIPDIVWACVNCRTEGGLRPAGKADVCSGCGTVYRRGRGAKIFVQEQGREARAFAPLQLIALLPDPGAQGTSKCTVREWVRDQPVYGLGRYLGRYECLGEPRAGVLTLTSDSLGFAADDDSGGFDIPLLDITAIQPSSRALQIKTRNRPVFSIRFDRGSPKLWEERLQKALTAAYQRAGLDEIAEYQPRVATRNRPYRGGTNRRLRRRLAGGADLSPPRPLQYRLASWIARNIWKYLGGGVTVEGLHNVPERGPFLLLVNHQSYLETMLVPAVMDRAACMMAKSTQFGSRVSGWFLAKLASFPVRRFEIDPQAIRFAVDRLSEGYGVIIFVEGERTWDGELQAARLGAVRLALKAGVPVIPCRVDGAYDAWPRWSSRPQRHRIRIAFGSAIELPQTETRSECEARLDQGVRLIRAAIDPSVPLMSPRREAVRR